MQKRTYKFLIWQNFSFSLSSFHKKRNFFQVQSSKIKVGLSGSKACLCKSQNQEVFNRGMYIKKHEIFQVPSSRCEAPWIFRHLWPWNSKKSRAFLFIEALKATRIWRHSFFSCLVLFDILWSTLTPSRNPLYLYHWKSAVRALSSSHHKN